MDKERSERKSKEVERKQMRNMREEKEMKKIKKRAGYELQIATKDSPSGRYLFLKSPNGSYHTFLEVAAKHAAVECGAKGRGKNTRQLCKEVIGF